VNEAAVVTGEMREIGALDNGRVTTELRRLGRADLERLLAALGRDGTERLGREMGLHVPVRFVRGGFASLCAQKIQLSTDAGRRLHLASLLAYPVFTRSFDLLGDNAREPTFEQVSGVLDVLIDEFGVQPVRLAFAVGIEHKVPAAPHLQRLLADPRLPSTGDKEGGVSPPTAEPARAARAKDQASCDPLVSADDPSLIPRTQLSPPNRRRLTYRKTTVSCSRRSTGC